MHALVQQHCTWLLRGALLAAVAGSSFGTARANCARPVTYELALLSRTVRVTPINEMHRGCPDASGMLRENLATHEIVRLPDVCGPVSESQWQARAYLDECVPPGRYRYGFAEPYACVGYACGTYLYEEITVTNELDNCQRTDPSAVPSSVAMAPWKSGSSPHDAFVCGYGGEEEEEDGGCSVRRPRGGAVFAIDMVAALAAGLALLRRRWRS